MLEHNRVAEPFPSSKLVITASVFYTDESIPAESILLAVVVSNKAKANAVSAKNGSVAEVAWNEHTEIVRAQQYLSVRGRSYLVGVECRCNDKSKSK